MSEQEAWSPDLEHELLQSRVDSLIGVLARSAVDPKSSSALEEVERIRAAFGGTQDFRSPAGPAAGLPGAAEGPAFPGYRIIAKAGAGGFGAVYRALDEKLGREVALKVILPHRDAASEEARAKFLKEARALARVRHPNVLTVHAVLEHEGKIALVTEFIEGRPLDDLVRETGPLSAAEAAQAGVEVARALAAVHAVGIVHRDVKPANVLREKGGRMVLADFGLGVFAAEGASGRGPVAGSPLYMAPEQARGEAIDRRTDLYALGVLLYHLATGKYPVELRGIQKVIEDVKQGRVIPIRDARPDLPEGFARVVSRALALEPGARYQTAGEMEEALLVSLGRGAQARDARGKRWLLAAVFLIAAALFFSVQHAFAPAGVQVTRAALYKEASPADVLLASGDAVAPGDNLYLEMEAPRRFHLYVLNEDERGERHLLFPRRAWALANPLEGGRRLRIPGASPDGKARAWEVSTQGGKEWIFIVASAAPVEELEALARGAAPEEYAAVQGESLNAVLRGIGKIAETKAPPSQARDGEGPRDPEDWRNKVAAVAGIKESKTAAESSSRPVLAEFTRGLQGLSEGARTATGFWVRAIHLRNP